MGYISGHSKEHNKAYNLAGKTNRRHKLYCLLEKVVNAIEKKGGGGTNKFSTPMSTLVGPTLVGRWMGTSGKEEVGPGFWAFLVVFVLFYFALSPCPWLEF